MPKAYRVLIILGVCLIAFPLITLFLFSFFTSNEYKSISNQFKPSSSQRGIVSQMLAEQEDFSGTIQTSFLDASRNTVEIKLTNNLIYDDSTRAEEYVAKIVRGSSTWKVVDYKTHWKCRGIFSFFWTINPCS